MQTQTPALAGHWGYIFELILGHLSGANSELRSVSYLAIPIFAANVRELIMPSLPFLLKDAFRETDDKCIVMVIEMIGRLCFHIPEVECFIEPAAAMISNVSMAHAGVAIIALASIAISFPHLGTEFLPILFENLVLVLKSGRDLSHVHQALKFVIDDCPDELISTVIMETHHLLQNTEFDSSNTAAAIDSVCLVMKHFALENEEQVIEMVRLIFRRFEEADNTLRLSFRTFLHEFVFKSDLSGPFLREVAEFAVSLLAKGIPSLEETAIVLITPIIQVAPTVFSSETIQLFLHRAIDLIQSGPAVAAKNSAAFLRCLACAVPDPDYAFQCLATRLCEEERSSAGILSMRQTILSALCAINQSCRLMSIDEFAERFDPFLPASSELNDLAYIYGYLEDQYENCSDSSKMKYFQWIAGFSMFQRQIPYFMRQGFLRSSHFVAMFRIVIDCLNRFGDAQAAVNATFSGNEMKIDNFRRFLNLLTLIAHNPDFFESAD
jgi:hypothetical protein